MTAERWEIIDEEFISYTGGTAQLISNGECEIHLWETPKDAQLFCDKLNAINEENEQLKQFQDTVFVLINEMIETANHYRTPIKSLDYGDDLGYWNGVYQKLKELREILEKEKGDVE